MMLVLCFETDVVIFKKTRYARDTATALKVTAIMSSRIVKALILFPGIEFPGKNNMLIIVFRDYFNHHPVFIPSFAGTPI